VSRRPDRQAPSNRPTRWARSSPWCHLRSGRYDALRRGFHRGGGEAAGAEEVTATAAYDGIRDWTLHMISR